MNGIYLHFLLHEIAGQLTGRSISELLINERFVQIRMRKNSLFISLYPDCLGMYFDASKKKEYTRDHFFSDAIRNYRIREVYQPGLQPVVELNLEYRKDDSVKKQKLIITFYREAPNFSIRHDNHQKNLFPRFIQKKPRPDLLEVLAEGGVSFDDLAGADLYMRYDGVDKSLARELSAERMAELKIMAEKKSYEPALISVSPLRISLFKPRTGRLFAGFNEIFKCSMSDYRELRLKDIRKALLAQHQKRLENSIERLGQELKNSKGFEEYMHQGNMLLANIDKISKGVNTITLIDPLTRQQKKIKLDPSLTPQVNAQKYFQLYKKFKRSLPKIERKIEQLKTELKNLSLDRIEQPDTRVAKRPGKSVPFRIFKLASGAIVYVGKSSQSNDALTFSFARPNDYFFHIRGYEGAHVILKAKVPKGQRPSIRDIGQSAEIAAYFSKAKGQKKVPVSYTQRKYLKKGKKSGPGAVIMLREEVIFVDPLLPES